MKIVLTSLKASQEPLRFSIFGNCCSTSFKVILSVLNKSKVNQYLYFPSRKDIMKFECFISDDPLPAYVFWLSSILVLSCFFFNPSVKTSFYTISICLNTAKCLPKFLHTMPSCTSDLLSCIFFCLKFIL